MSAYVEAILPYDDVNVFVEAKMSLFHDAVLIEDIPAKLQSRLERVTGAVQQGQKVSRLLRKRPNAFPARAEKKEEFLIVVTSREVHIGGALALQRLLPGLELGTDDADLAARMPLENVFLMSIETFERLRGVVSSGKVGLVALLREAAASNSDSRTSAVYFEDHLKKHHKGNWPVPPLFSDQRDAAKHRIETAFSAPLSPQ